MAFRSALIATTIFTAVAMPGTDCSSHSAMSGGSGGKMGPGDLKP